MLAAILVFLAVRYVRGHQYMEYTVAWEKEIPSPVKAVYGYKFGENAPTTSEGRGILY